ncbi:MAG: bifunctional DNA-formamidopyrimidine glycosylase/DNA-(apurinic or apyrimidinic site) lyase [Candidatus Falkowbacteria bacterium]
MPELPEVETIKRDLVSRVLGKKINAVIVLAPKTVFPAPPKFKSLLTGQSFVGIDRIGKLLIFSLSDQKHFLLVHLKMTGQLIYSFHKELIAGGHSLKAESLVGYVGGELPNRSTRAYFTLSDQSQLFFNDQRRFGYLKIVESGDLDNIKLKYGIEPLTPGFTKLNFIKAIGKREKNIKALLLDQSLISGLGNIYVDEALFAAGIRPSRRARSLSKAEIERLYSVIEVLIKKAIKYRGTTFNNYLDAQGKKGSFVSKLQVYGRNKQTCLKCGGIIEKVKIAGRGTHFCSHCQK